MTKVQWSVGYTVNLGNFESLRLDVGVEDHARADESVQDASDRVYKFVERALSEKVKEAREELER